MTDTNQEVRETTDYGNILDGLKPDPMIDTTLFVSADRQCEMSFRATLPYAGREEIEAALRAKPEAQAIIGKEAGE